MDRNLTWTPSSWKKYPRYHIPDYQNEAELQAVVERLGTLPPLVTSWEIIQLRQKLSKAAKGEAFLLHGGDCAELFRNCTSPKIVDFLKVLLQMSLIMIIEMHLPVIRIGRFAGQYSKPRSNPTEIVDGKEMFTYRGDLINAAEADVQSRIPDPKRLIEGYQTAALTLNFVRSLVKEGGFANIHHAEYWEMDFMQNNPFYQDYKNIVGSIGSAIDFISLVSEEKVSALEKVSLFSSHEGLNLHYEGAQTRQVPHNTGWFNMTAHYLWIGQRTKQLDGAHLEYFRGIENPIGVKIGPPVDNSEIVQLVEKLNPNNDTGKITLITRFGQDKVEEYLPTLVRTIKRAGLNVLWSCDPMHGNTFTTKDKIKSRKFEHILSEIDKTFVIHNGEGSRLGGIHLELTGNNVTECVGGATGLGEEHLSDNYQTFCDPRLNYEQSLELAFAVSRQWKKLFA